MMFAQPHCPHLELTMIRAHMAAWVVFVASRVGLTFPIGCNSQERRKTTSCLPVYLQRLLCIPKYFYDTSCVTHALVMVSKSNCLYQILRNSLKLSEVVSRLMKF